MLDRDSRTHDLLASLAVFVLLLATPACSSPEPENPAENLHRQAESLRLAGDLRQALPLYQQAVEADMEYAPAYLGMAQAYSALGDYPEGEKNYLLATTMAPDDFAAHLNFAGFYYRNRNYGRALQVLQKAMDLAPEEAEATMVSGLWARVETAQVRATVREGLVASLAENPDDESVAAALSESYSTEAADLLQSGNVREALDVIAQGMQTVPEAAQASLYYVGAQAQEASETHATAVEWLDKAIELDGSVPSYHLSRAGFHIEDREFEQAMGELDKVIELAPTSEEAEFARLRRQEVERIKDLPAEELDLYMRGRSGRQQPAAGSGPGRR